MVWLACGLAAAAVLAGCNGAGPEQPVPITQRPTPAAAVTALAPSDTPTASATPSETATPSPRPPTPTASLTPAPPERTPDPLSITFMRRQSYPGSAIVFDQTLQPGSNYDQFIVHYTSEGLKIYALLTIPQGPAPASGWPVIVFNHGYIPPADYRPNVRYEKYVDAMAAHGYIVFKPDYRGHGQSEGEATGAYRTPAYTIDVLNAVASIARFSKADPKKIGMWGHSMGGQITLRAMVTTCCLIRAGVIWAGVVEPYYQIITQWEITPTAPGQPSSVYDWRLDYAADHGTLQNNPGFWNDISPNSFLGDISGPLEIQHGTGDFEVSVEMSRILYSQMLQANKPVYYYEYPGDDHNISKNFALAMQRTLDFFDEYVKGP